MASDRPRKYRPVRTPTVLQMEAVECGAAALGIVLEYFGRYVPLDVLRNECGVSRDGSNAYYIKQAARQYGLETDAFRKPAEGLWTKSPPLIVLWQWNHFLVVEGFARGIVYLNDPACGRRTVSREEFARSYSGIAFTFRPGPKFVKKGRRPSALVGLARRLATSKAAVSFVILAGLALVVPTLLAAGYQRTFIDEILVQRRLTWLKPLLIAVGITALVRLAAVALQQVYLTRLEVRLALGESVRFLQHVLRLPVSFFQHRFAGDIVGRIGSTARVAHLISGELATTAVSLLTLVFFILAMYPQDKLLTVVGTAIGSVNLVALRWLSRWRIDQNRSLEQIRGRLWAGVMWAIQIIESVKATGSESDLMVRWTGDQARVVSGEQQLGSYDTFLVALSPFLAVVSTIVILALGGKEVAEGTLTIGALVAFQTLLASFNQPFRDLSRLGSQLQELRADLDRIDDVRHHQIDPVLEPRPAAVPANELPRRDSLAASASRLSGHLELRNVTFGYNRTVEEPLIKDFSLVVRPGERVALVGGSGSGKTTLARLITGLYQPWSGAILHDGKPICEIPRELFVNSVAMVDERIAMFQGTVRENMTLWDDQISSQRLIQAGLGAAIHRDLLGRRGGYDAVVAEGARNFSGGQRQRLEIGRSLVRDPSLLILDEATSALDPKTEAMVDDHLRRRGCTCLIVAHRLSTIRDCDQIIVLADGRVVQRGTHEQLLADPQGEYARLVASQELPSSTTSQRTAHRFRSVRQSLHAAAFQGNSEAAFRALPRETAALLSSSAPTPPLDGDVESPRFLIDELELLGQREETAANRSLPLDDPESVWWVSAGQVDVFFTSPGLDQRPGQRRHLCRVDEGGTIFAISGVRGYLGGGLLAVGVGTAKLLRFARGDLIRLSFEEKLAEQVAVLIDDWIVRVGRALSPAGVNLDRCELPLSVVTSLPAEARYGVRHGVAWIRHTHGASDFLEEIPLPLTEQEARFPLSEHLWLTAGEGCQVSAIDTLAMVRSGDPWAGLMDFHRAVLDQIGWATEREASLRQTEFQSAIDGERAMVDEFSSRLAAVANQTESPTLRADGDALLAACRAIGRELRVEVRPPRKSTEDESVSDGERLVEIARASGLHLRQVNLPHDWPNEGSGEPMLGALADEVGRPVALLPAKSPGTFGSRSYDLYDPVSDSRQAVDEHLSKKVAPTAWAFYRTLPDHSLNLVDLLRFCLPRVAAEGRLVLMLAGLGGLLGLVLPIGSGILVDQIIPEVTLPGTGWSRLVALSCFMIGLAAALAVVQVVQGLALLRIEGRVVPMVVPAVWDRLLRLPARFFAGYSSGDLALRAMGLSQIFKKISGAAVATLFTGLVSLGNLVLMFCYSWRLALVISLLVAIMVLVMMLLLAGQLRQEARIRKVEGTIIGFLLDVIGGITKLRTAGAENRAFARWATRHAEQLELTMRARRYANRLHRLFAIFPMLIAMFLYFAAIYLDPAQMSTGDFLALTLAATNVVTAVLAAGYTLLGLLDLPPLYNRVSPILEARPEFPAAVLEPIRLGGALALGAVSFHYPGQEDGKKILRDVSIQVRPGEFVAIVGASGSGKSTLLRLLLGFETPDSGTVSYDGRELATLDVREVRRQIGVVLQHAQLMPGDIYSNIVGFAPGLTLDDAWHAAGLAGLEDEIRRLPMGMHTLVGEGGGNLSGGQRQRLLISRAIVRRPRILMFDEATSALDNVTQAIVTDSITRELRGVTRLVIAHRLTTVVGADRIYVMKQGQIVQSGQYHQLLEEPGPFQELVHRQAT
jgi:NHLM bacteriocin system ABC transporter peptidase/ATP-binding protein/NHLM bacteriocin system ABC transporter ATP-binding protein